MQHPIQTNTPDDFSSILKKDERILWSEPRRQVMDSAINFLLGGTVVLLVISGALGVAFLWKGSTEDNEATPMLFLGLALCCLITAACMVLNNRRQIHVLTRQRAIIARRSTRRLSCIREFPCSPDLLQHIVRYENGRTDFIFDWQRLGRTLEISVGFIGVLQAEELKAELTLCGVKLPAEDVPGSEPDAPPTLGKLITPILAAALLIGYVIHEVQTNDKLFLTFRGEQASATISGFHPEQHLEGSRHKGQWVTYYHPILQFLTAQQTPRKAIDLIGDKVPINRPGEQVDILYHPQHPSIAMRVTNQRFERPIAFLLGLLIILVVLCFRLRQLYLFRRQSRKPNNS